MTEQSSDLEMVIAGLRASVEGLAVELKDPATTQARKDEIEGWFRGLYAMLLELKEDSERS
jgi:hypothetical protein